MTDLNHIIVIGRITQDLGTDERSFGHTKGGTAKANISIAVNRSVKQGEQWTDEVSYFNVEVWGKTAENLKQHFVKGKQIAVAGYLKQDRWKDKDGRSRDRVYIVANNIQLLGGKSENQQTGNQNAGSFNPAEGFPEDMPF